MFDQKTSPVYSSLGVMNRTGVAPATGGVTPSIAFISIRASPFATAEVIGAKSVITKVANRDEITRVFIVNTVANQSVLLQSFDRGISSADVFNTEGSSAYTCVYGWNDQSRKVGIYNLFHLIFLPIFSLSPFTDIITR